jgi:hypothetical protein
MCLCNLCQELGLNSGLHTHKAGTLLPEPHLQATLLWLLIYFLLAVLGFELRASCLLGGYSYHMSCLASSVSFKHASTVRWQETSPPHTALCQLYHLYGEESGNIYQKYRSTSFGPSISRNTHTYTYVKRSYLKR